MVENVGVAVDISTKSHSLRQKHCTSGLLSAILIFGGRFTSDNVAVGCVTIGSGMVDHGRNNDRWNFCDVSFR